MTYLEKAKYWARRMKRDVVTIHFAMQDPGCPRYLRFLGVLIVAYALSPIDLIPDFIPVLGYLDDLLIVPLGIRLIIHLLPEDILAVSRKKANANRSLPSNRVAAAFIIVIWLAGVGITIVWLMNG
mgnify:CR=1 FL=1